MAQPKILSVANSKGGVGKSTTTIILASAIAKHKKKKVLIIDTDSQESVINWLVVEKQDYDEEDQPLVTVVRESPNHVRLFLDKYGEDYDLIFIDIPRMTNSMNESANVQLLYLCDSILIPVLGSRLDVLSTQKFYSIIKDAAAKRKELGFPFKAYAFLNRENNLKDNIEAKNLMEEVIKIPMLNSTLRDLKIFKTPSLYESILDTAEGRRRFEPFYKEVIKKFKIT